MIKRIERGWAGHFCGSGHCSFRRNTLLEGNNKVVVSTVGGYSPYGYDRKVEQIGNNRYYETMALRRAVLLMPNADVTGLAPRKDSK